MSNLAQLPIFRALFLTLVITGVFSIFLVSDPQVEGLDMNQQAEAQQSVIAKQQRAIEALHRRVARIEETRVEQMIDDLRSEMEFLRHQRSASPDLPLPVSAVNQPGPQLPVPSVNDSHIQEFELRNTVTPEAIVIVQGDDPQALLSVEILDEWNQWVEVYRGPDTTLDPTAETWIDCVGTAATDRVRVEVSGGSGIEAIGVAVEDTVRWSMVTN